MIATIIEKRLQHP